MIPHLLFYLFSPSIHPQIQPFAKPQNRIENIQEHSRTPLKNQTHFSRCYGTQKSTYNIPKRREKHALQHGIIKTIKQSRLQKFTI